MEFRPVMTRRTFEEAVEQIAEAIHVGDLRVGDRLPSERELATQMQISRPTVREAIALLADAGIVSVKTGRAGGMFVVTEDVPRQLLKERSALRVSEVREVLEARRVLEPRVAQLAALYATEEDFERLQRTIDLQRQFAEDHNRSLRLDLRFHLLMARATKNSTILAMMRFLLRQLEIARDMALRGWHDADVAIAIHERTLQAIMGGDPETIDAAMDEHLSYLERIWEEESGRTRLRTTPDFLLRRADRTLQRPAQ